MTRYALFAGLNHTKSGGWHDFDSTHDSLESAKVRADGLDTADYDWAHIVDLDSASLVMHREVVNTTDNGEEPGDDHVVLSERQVYVWSEWIMT